MKADAPNFKKNDNCYYCTHYEASECLCVKYDFGLSKEQTFGYKCDSFEDWKTNKELYSLFKGHCERISI